MLIDTIKIESCKDVYYPREDSYLLAEAVEKYAFGSVLDLGTGIGIQGIAAALKGCSVTFSDISEKALECAKKNAKNNNIDGKFAISDMFSNISEKFNTIIFNPPYLPDEGLRSKDIALDGGVNGRKYIDAFLREYKKHLKSKHVVLLLESSLDNYGDDLKRSNAKVVASTRIFFEELVVIMMRSNRS